MSEEGVKIEEFTYSVAYTTWQEMDLTPHGASYTFRRSFLLAALCAALNLLSME